jgi:hypothetical protein
MAETGIKNHEVWVVPNMQQVRAFALIRNCSEEAALEELLKLRDAAMRDERRDPFRCGWEPPIWQVARAMAGLPCYDQMFLHHIRDRFGFSWERWAEEMRKLLQFPESLKMILIMGGNRTAKSEFNAKWTQEYASHHDDAIMFAAHMSGPKSVTEQQPLYWKYMPAEWQIDVQEREAYIKYKAKTGFSDNSFINPRRSWVIFLSYLQDASTALEGSEPNGVAADELIPPEWIEAIDIRLSTRDGVGFFTFTPVHGYTASVKIFEDSARTVRESIGYMLPRDGGEPDVARTLNLSEEEYRRLLYEEANKLPVTVPQSRPEDVCAWMENGGIGRGAGDEPRMDANGREWKKEEYDGVERPFGFGNAQIDCPGNRSFEMVPRVKKCVNPKYGVIYFHPSDNPYGNPKVVVRKAATKGRSWVRMRGYGIADKAVSNRFPAFDTNVHVLPDDKLPVHGRWYMFLDPASDRNFYMTWFCVPDAVVVWQEWPGSFEIPDVGHPGPWAVPSGRKNGINDGAKGDAQDSFGFGLMKYKCEIARIEGWEDYKRWRNDARGDLVWPDPDDVFDWDADNGADIVLDGRGIDLRAAGSPRVDRGEVVTLEDDLNGIGLFFDYGRAPRRLLEDDGGVQKINDALDFDRDEQMSFRNAPKLYVAERCANTIFSMQNWCGADGQKGACKDPIDNVINFFNSGLADASCPEPRGGFSRRTRFGERGKSVRDGRRPRCLDW